SQFGAEFIHGFHERIGDPEAPQLKIQSFGYMYLAGSEKAAAALRTSHAAQIACGAATRLMTPDQIAAEYPFYNLEGVVLGSHNPVNEGYFDGATIFDWWRKIAKRRGVSYLTGEVTGLSRAGNRITGVTLADGTRIACGMVVNAAGPRAATIAGMAGLEIPIEPRRRYTYIFDAAEPLGQDLPLTIDPSGVHMRTDGRYYLCGCPPFDDHAMAFDDFSEEPGIWEEKLWPALAHRVPAFERIKVIRSWVGHYAYNTLDHNAVIGFAPEVGKFLVMNGFSGHGFQHSPAMGRGAAELICHGRYESLDLSPLGPERLATGTPLRELAII
ncbi:MAG: FAD-binding oxidoreductase, partial [Pseudomonadota bacterium]